MTWLPARNHLEGPYARETPARRLNNYRADGSDPEGREWGEAIWTAPDMVRAERVEDHERTARLLSILLANGASPE